MKVRWKDPSSYCAQDGGGRRALEAWVLPDGFSPSKRESYLEG